LRLMPTGSRVSTRHAAALACCLLLALAGCTTAGFSPDMSGPTEIAPERSITALPETLADQRLAVRIEIRDSLMFERVVLANDTALAGENAVTVRTRWRGTPYRRWFSGPMRNPYTDTAIGHRVRDEFADLADVTPPLDRTNRRGPYRYVAASGEGGRCVLAWQIVDAEASVTGDVHPFALDFRYCDPARDPVALLALFDQIELAPHL
jgi:hypothetical protein